MAALLRIAQLATLISLVAAQGGTQDPNNQFIYPPRGGQSINENATIYSTNINITYGEPQRQSFQWKTNYTRGLNIFLWQEGPPSSVQNKELLLCSDADSTNNQFYWDGDIGQIDINNGSVAFLIAYTCNARGVSSTDPFFYSHYFNLTEAATPTSSSTPTSIATSDPTKQSGTSGNSPSQTPSGSSDSGSSNAAALGGGIGGGIGGALLLIAAGLGFYYYRRRTKARNSQSQPAYTPMAQNPPSGYANGGVYNSQGAGPASAQAPSELGGSTTTDSNYGYYDGREYKPPRSPGRPAELGA